ncbi:MAG TPA: Co2+/Mg2+ efflux protein ApaG [Gemmatirosa sp.]
MAPRQPPFFYRETEGVRVTVRPSYLRDQSRPAAGQYVFAYHIRIENIGPVAAQLLARRWTITDSTGEVTEVEGEGVVGEQPVLHPGRVHEYRSFCVLKSERGHMEGRYRFVRADGDLFDVDVPRFTLDADGA